MTQSPTFFFSVIIKLPCSIFCLVIAEWISLLLILTCISGISIWITCTTKTCWISFATTIQSIIIILFISHCSSILWLPSNSEYFDSFFFICCRSNIRYRKLYANLSSTLSALKLKTLFFRKFWHIVKHILYFLNWWVILIWSMHSLRRLLILYVQLLNWILLFLDIHWNWRFMLAYYLSTRWYLLSIWYALYKSLNWCMHRLEAVLRYGNFPRR